MYDEAVKFYEQAAKIAHDDIEKFKHLKKDIIIKEATIYSNLAACYK
jgi:rubrerythrin